MIHDLFFGYGYLVFCLCIFYPYFKGSNKSFICVVFVSAVYVFALYINHLRTWAKKSKQSYARCRNRKCLDGYICSKAACDLIDKIEGVL